MNVTAEAESVPRPGAPGKAVNGFRLAGCLALALLALGPPGTTWAQPANLSAEFVPYVLDSGPLDNPGPAAAVVYDVLIDAGADRPWVRVFFGPETTLGVGSYIRTTSMLDGDWQILTAETLSQWQNSTCFFNGSLLRLELIAPPGSVGDRVQVEKLLVGGGGIDGPAEGDPLGSVCPRDDRRVFNDPAVCRLLPSVPWPNQNGPCTGFIIDQPAGGNDKCHLTAGHCLTNDPAGLPTQAVAQFDVPLSLADCTLVHPPARKQFAIRGFEIDAHGHAEAQPRDWGVFTLFPNPNTGNTSFQEQGQAKTLADADPPVGTPVRVTGYGQDGTDERAQQPRPPGDKRQVCTCTPGNGTGTRHRVCQTHTGLVVDHPRDARFLSYTAQTCEGSSGSPVMREVNPGAGQIVGIHTAGDNVCPSRVPQSGTRTTLVELREAILRCAAMNRLPPCPSAAEGGLPEGEACGASNNGGCNATPQVFTRVQCGQTICGNVWADGGRRDEDWYELAITTTTRISVITGTNRVPVFPAILNDRCPPGILATTNVPANSWRVISATVGPGTYRIAITPQVFQLFPCPAPPVPADANDYRMRVICEPIVQRDLACPGGAVPENEPCGNAVNNGCNVTPPQFGDIRCGETVCGSTFANAGNRDSDWYTFSVTETTRLSVTLRTEAVPLEARIVGAACPAPTLAVGQAAPWTDAGFVHTVAPGTYRLVVEPQPGVTTGFPCATTTEYHVTLACALGEPCPAPLICPNDGRAEGEVCGGNTNGGCNSTPPVFTGIACGQTFCGTTWASGGTRDTDWYEFTLTTTTTVTATVRNEEVPLLSHLRTRNCPSVFLRLAEVPRCGQASWSARLPAGTYVVFVAPGDAKSGIFDGYPCGPNNEYQLQLACGAGPAPCTNCPRGLTCPGDANGDRCVNQMDLGDVLAAYGSRLGDARYNGCADFDCDGDVDQQDLAEVLARWLQCCPGSAGNCTVAGGACN